jgi:hypothetical protein
MLHEQKSFKLILINCGYWLVNIPLIVGVVYVVSNALPAAEEVVEPEVLNQLMYVTGILV